MTTKLLLTQIIVWMFSASTLASIVVDDDFDSYADQTAFESVWLPIGTTSDSAKKSAQLSTAQFTSSPNSVHAPVSTTATLAATEYRNRRTFLDTPSLGIGDLLRWSFDFYDSNVALAPQRNTSNLQDTTSPTTADTNKLVSMGLNNNQSNTDSGGAFYMARIVGYNPVALAPDPEGGPAESIGGTAPFFKLNDFGVGLRSAGWHNLRVDISTDDGLATDYAFYVDNVLAERVNDVGGADTLRQYDNIVIGSGLTNGGVDAYFDNQYLEFIPKPTAVVPEPGSIFVWGLISCCIATCYGLRRTMSG